MRAYLVAWRQWKEGEVELPPRNFSYSQGEAPWERRCALRRNTCCYGVCRGFPRSRFAERRRINPQPS